jgi:hypothetical protein
LRAHSQLKGWLFAVPASSHPKSLAHQRIAHLSWAKTVDWSARTEKARRAADERFLAQADGDPKRVEQLRKAFYLGIAQKSAEARRRNRDAKKAAHAVRVAALLAGDGVDDAGENIVVLAGVDLPQLVGAGRYGSRGRSYGDRVTPTRNAISVAAKTPHAEHAVAQAPNGAGASRWPTRHRSRRRTLRHMRSGSSQRL